MTKTTNKFNKETIALNPVRRPKNGQQFMAKRLPYWKTSEYKKAVQESRQSEKPKLDDVINECAAKAQSKPEANEKNNHLEL